MRGFFDGLIEKLQWLVSRMAVDASPEPWVLALALVMLAPAVAYRPVWVVLRHGVTIIHEMGHVIMGWLWGRRIDGISLHTDTSGLTISAGKPHGLGVLMTYLSGYTAPPAVGLVFIWAATHGWSGLALTSMVVVLLSAFWLVRNVWGLLTVSVSLLGVGLIFWHGDPVAITTTVAVLGMFLIMSGLRGGFDLWAVHAHGDGSSSDATMAAQNSLIPTMFWVWFFGVFGFVCGLYGAWSVLLTLA